MTEPSPSGGQDSLRHIGLEAETTATGRISGLDVSVTYDLNEIGISWNSKDRVHLAFQDATVSAGILTGTGRDDLIWLRLDVAAGHSRLAVDLPFYSEQFSQLRTFADALNALFPGSARPKVASVKHGTACPDDELDHRPSGEAATFDRGHPGGNDPNDKRERQTVPVVTIKIPPLQWADDNDWISLRPPAETQRLLHPSYQESAVPESKNSQLG